MTFDEWLTEYCSKIDKPDYWVAEIRRDMEKANSPVRLAFEAGLLAGKSEIVKIWYGTLPEGKDDDWDEDREVRFFNLGKDTA